jgi:hypothetical protein
MFQSPLLGPSELPPWSFAVSALTITAKYWTVWYTKWILHHGLLPTLHIMSWYICNYYSDQQIAQNDWLCGLSNIQSHSYQFIPVGSPKDPCSRTITCKTNCGQYYNMKLAWYLLADHEFLMQQGHFNSVILLHAFSFHIWLMKQLWPLCTFKWLVLPANKCGTWCLYLR